MIYCHCKDCQAWSAGPINSASLWNPDLLEVTKGQEYIETFNKTEHSYRKFCKKCGGHLMNEHPGLKLIDIYAVILNSFSYKPTIHIHYESKTVSVKDGLPKFKDMPEELGGISYEELRARHPQEVSDDIVRLLANSAEALEDFAMIQTEQDINTFNKKYGVNLVLPSEG